MTKAWHYGIPRCLSSLVLGFIEDLLESNVYDAIIIGTVTEKNRIFPFWQDTHLATKNEN